MTEPNPLISYYRDQLAKIYGGQRWMIAFDVLATTRFLVETLHDLGGGPVLCIGGSRGTGDLPNPELAPNPIDLGVKATSVMGGIRGSAEAMANLGREVQAQIDRFDPEGVVRVLAPIFDDGTLLGGRQKYARRPKSWQRLEDKTIIDDLWDELAVPKAPHAIVEPNRSDLAAAAKRLDRGLGTVWVADNKEGFHGGGEYLRWVRTEAQADEAALFLSSHCDRARVMPFLEGIPCSIHGVVFPDEVISLRPCEMLVFRRPDSMRLHYGRAATFWDPPAEDREEMRRLAKRVGAHLRASVGFRGAFTIDGVMTADGFLPTELNPRYGAALGVLVGPLKGLHLNLMNRAIVEGEDIDWRPAELEALIIESADANRAGSVTAMITQKAPSEDTCRAALTWDPATSAFTAVDKVTSDGVADTTDSASVADEAAADATAIMGPASFGTYVNVNLNSDTMPVGPAAAPRAAAALRCLDSHWGLGLGTLEPAKDVRG